jgi:hypothetical protein
MRLLTTLTALALAASAALAQTAGFCVVKSPGNYETVTAGSRYTVRWEPGAIVSAGAADAQITISLLGGDSPGTLQHLGWIQSEWWRGEGPSVVLPEEEEEARGGPI